VDDARQILLIGSVKISQISLVVAWGSGASDFLGSDTIESQTVEPQLVNLRRCYNQMESVKSNIHRQDLPVNLSDDMIAGGSGASDFSASWTVVSPTVQQGMGTI